MLHTLIGEVNINWSKRGADFERAERIMPTVIKSVVASNTPKNKESIEWATAIACAVLIPG